MEPHPTLDQLQVFLAAAETGSFSGAARRLNRTQSVVSYAIAQLEAQIGLSLFQRAGSRAPRLTEAGAALLEDARRMVAGLEQLRARARGLQAGLEGEVALAVDVLLPTPVLTTALKAFRDAFPTVPVRLHTGALGVVAELLFRRVAGIGIAGRRSAESADLASRLVGGARFLPVAAPDHPLAGRPGPVPLASVREHFQIVVTDTTGRTEGRDFGVLAFDTWRVTDIATKRALILEGLGWGGLPQWMVEADIAQGRLVALDLEPYPPFDYRFFAVHRADTPLRPAAAWLADRFAQGLADFAGTTG